MWLSDSLPSESKHRQDPSSANLRRPHLDCRNDWHRFFYLLTGLLAVTSLAVVIFLPDQPAQQDRDTHLGREIDWLGGLLSIAGLMLIFYVLAVAPGAKDGWGTPCK